MTAKMVMERTTPPAAPVVLDRVPVVVPAAVEVPLDEVPAVVVPDAVVVVPVELVAAPVAVAVPVAAPVAVPFVVPGVPTVVVVVDGEVDGAIRRRRGDPIKDELPDRPPQLQLNPQILSASSSSKAVRLQEVHTESEHCAAKK